MPASSLTLTAATENNTASEAYAAALAATDLDDALGSFAHSIRLRLEAGHDIVTIDVSAAAADPEIRAEVAAANAMRSGGIARLARRLGQLEGGLDPPRVEALLDALTHTAMYEQLVANHGWSSDDYESWLASALRRDIRDSTQALGHEIER